MPAFRDIRHMIPQFDPNFFEPYERAGKDYPKMMINKESGKPYLDKRKQPVVVASEDEEARFWVDNGVTRAVEPAQAVEVAIEEPIKRGPGRPPMPKNLTA